MKNPKQVKMWCICADYKPRQFAGVWHGGSLNLPDGTAVEAFRTKAQARAAAIELARRDAARFRRMKLI